MGLETGEMIHKTDIKFESFVAATVRPRKEDR